MADMTPITYSDDAYSGEHAVAPRQEESEHSRRFRMSAASGQRLPHRHPTVDIAPMARGLEIVLPKQLRHIESQPDHTPRPSDRGKYPIRMDEECLRYTSQTKVNFILGVVRLGGVFGFGMFVIGGVLMSLILTFMSMSDDRIGLDDYLIL